MKPPAVASAPASERIRMVFLGCGAVTAAHSRTLRRFQAEVQCFYASRDGLKAAGFEERFRGGGSFGSYEAALADGHMDVAFVATPPSSHLSLTLQALESGKDVIVEKPPFLCAADFERVRAAQARSGRRVFVAENYAYKPLARVLRALLEAGTVGEPRFIQINALKSQPARDWRADARESGGGALFEGGIHWIDLAAHLGPAVRRVQVVRAGTADPERSSLVVLEYEGGAVGTLAYSWEIPGRLRGLQLSRISGTRGSIVFESNGLFVLVSGARRRLILPGVRDLTGTRGMFRDFFTALRSGREPVMTLERAQLGVEIARSAFRRTD